MAEYRMLVPGKPIPPPIEEPLVMAGYAPGYYTLSIGDLRIALTPAEHHAVVETWSRTHRPRE